MTKRNSTLFIVMVAAYLSLPVSAFSQTLLPPNQPEQVPCHALSLCGGKFFTPYSYQGVGGDSALTQTPCQSGEDNAMWIKVTIATPGTLAFAIIPKDTLDDYDFAVLDITNGNCSNLSPSEVVRCNFNNNELGSNPMGIVGLSTSGTGDFVPSNYTGNSFALAINANAGETYLIMINNFGHDDDPGPSNGFTIDFSTSTATFVSDSLPAFQNTLNQCSDSNVVVSLNKPISCSSIAADGSDFTITPAVPIAGAAGHNCVGGNGYTQEIVVTLGGHIAPGNYMLHAQKGSNGTTILDLCGDAMSLPDSVPFVVPPPITGKFLPPDTTKCSYATITINALRQFVAYQWYNGSNWANGTSIAVTDPGLYSLQVIDANGCTATDSINVKDSTCPQYIYIPTAFTPNGDGKNDRFKAVFAGPNSDFKLAVYDRWGRMVFETSDPSAGWDGTTGGNPQPAGTYAWVCIYRLYQQPQRMQRGTVILIR